MPVPSGPQFKFFHGTTHSFEVGDVVYPASIAGSEPLHDETDVEAAYATSDLDSARFWADEAASKRADSRPRVFGVEPLGKVLPDLHSHNDDDVRSREGWRVLGEVEPE